VTLNNSFLDLLTCNVRDYYGGNKDIVLYCNNGSGKHLSYMQFKDNDKNYNKR